jgi:hypothetical protein
VRHTPPQVEASSFEKEEIMSEEMKKQNPTEVKKENAQPELTETDLKTVSGGLPAVQSQNKSDDVHLTWIEI